jgi:hypothetical protein
LQWVYPNKLFPTEVRGSAVGLASSLSRIGAAVCAVWAAETRSLSLDEAAAL